MARLYRSLLFIGVGGLTGPCFGLFALCLLGGRWVDIEFIFRFVVGIIAMCFFFLPFYLVVFGSAAFRLPPNLILLAMTVGTSQIALWLMHKTFQAITTWILVQPLPPVTQRFVWGWPSITLIVGSIFMLVRFAPLAYAHHRTRSPHQEA